MINHSLFWAVSYTDIIAASALRKWADINSVKKSVMKHGNFTQNCHRSPEEEHLPVTVGLEMAFSEKRL